MPKVTELHINGAKYSIDADADVSLLSVLRDQFDLTGSKYGCGEGQCGACTVLLDGSPRRSCITPVGAAAHKAIITIEGLEKDGQLHAVQQGFLDEGVMQCGYCTSGMIMAAVGLLKVHPDPTEQEISHFMQGNICRCGTYPRIVAAIRRAAKAQVAGAFGLPLLACAGATLQEHRDSIKAEVTKAGAQGVAAAAPAALQCGATLLAVPHTGCEPVPPGKATEPALRGAKGPESEPCATREVGLEPERYELSAPPTYHFAMRRRDFFKVLGGGIVVLCLFDDPLAAQEYGRAGFPRQAGRGGGEPLPQNISAWLHIGENGEVTVYTGKVEAGQNIRTSLTQAVAEELHVAPAAIQLVMGDTARTPFDMGTFGSRTTPTMSPQLRRAAATAREVLIDLAAEAWKADRAKLVAAHGSVTDPETQRRVSYAELAKGRELAQTISAEDPLTPAAQWKVMGESLPKVTGRDLVTGKHRYASDVKLPGMLYGKVLRPAAFGATLTSLDSHEAEAMPGVTVVHDGNFAGVTAPTPQLAQRALAALRAEWKTTPQPSSAELFDYLKKNVEASNERGRQTLGSMEKGLAEASHRLQQTYTVAYIAHTPLEPRAALAEWKEGNLNVWTGTQRPFGVRRELAEAFRIPEDRVHVQMPDMGAGYGGKHTGDAAVEAARLAQAARRPVKLVWTREEEFTWAYFRPAGVIEITAGVASDGAITAWEFHNYNSGAAAIATPYDIPNQRIEFHAVKSPLRQGSYRCLAATANHFARESFMDELAHLAKMDPLEFRLRNLKDERLRAVFEAAAQKFGWGQSKPQPGHGWGIAGGIEKGGHLATCAEVAVDPSTRQVHVVRVVAAFDCGAVVNPDHLRNQIAGAHVMGLGGALFEAIKFENGRILNARLSQYRVPRFSDAPSIEVVLVDRKDQPSAGAGETPIVGIAPAVGNAIFAATGKRLRALPMAPNWV